MFLATVPGFTKLVFMVLSAASLIALALRRPRDGKNVEPLAVKNSGSTLNHDVTASSASSSLTIELSVCDRSRFDLPRFARDGQALRSALHQELGILFPPARLSFSEELGEGQTLIRIFESSSTSGPLLMPDGGFDIAHLGAVLRRHAAQFLSIEEVSALIASMACDYPDLVSEALHAIGLEKIADVLRRLAEEGVSICNLRDVLESLVEAGRRVSDVVLLTEHARIGLKRYLSSRHLDTNRALQALLLHPQLENKIRQAIRVTGGCSHLALDPELAERFLTSLRTQRAGLGVKSSTPPAVLTSLDVRRFVRELIETEFFDTPVLSYHELAPEVTVHPVAQLNA